MKFRNIDSNGDWNFGKGLQNYVSESTAIILDLRTRLYCFLNDCFWDRNSGIDWFNLLSQKNNSNILGLEIKRIINSTDGITAINNFEVIYDTTTRKYSLTCNVDTIYSSNINQILENIGD